MKKSNYIETIMKKSIYVISAATLLVTAISCKQKQQETSTNVTPAVQVEKSLYDVNNPKGMLQEVSKTIGGIDGLKKLHDISFTYNYVHPDGKKDISTEKYIFENEISWAKYTTHQINVAPNLNGDIVQFYDGEKAFVHNNGKAVTDAQIVGTGQFLRQANYMWFTMMNKLTDPGTIHKYLGQEIVEGTTYDKVHISYDPEITGKKENDIYIVYINPVNKMVEQFKFSLPAFKVMEPILLAKLTYTDIEGVKVVTTRNMFSPTPNGTYTPMVTQTLENIKFNNGFTVESLRNEI